MFVVYSKRDEVLVTTKKQEKAFVELVFGVDRWQEDYDREEIEELGVVIESAGFHIQ